MLPFWFHRLISRFFPTSEPKPSQAWNDQGIHEFILLRGEKGFFTEEILVKLVLPDEIRNSYRFRGLPGIVNMSITRTLRSQK
jgi:hypothetical protein